MTVLFAVLLTIALATCKKVTLGSPDQASPILSNKKSSSVDDTVTGDLTMQEVAKHATSSDCWVVVFDRVHNLTSFIPRHPGGPSRILVACGKNATDTFLNAGYVHDTIARDTLR